MNKSTFILVLTSLGIDPEYALNVMAKAGITFTFFTTGFPDGLLNAYDELNKMCIANGLDYFEETSLLNSILSMFFEVECAKRKIEDGMKNQARRNESAEYDRQADERQRARQSSYTAPKATVGFDPFQVLGVSPSTPKDQIKSAYRRLAAQLHPDVNSSADAHEKMAQLNNAYAAIR